MIEAQQIESAPGYAVRFETGADLERESRAIRTFVNSFRGGPGSFEKLGPNEIDFRVFNAEGKVIAYAEVKGRLRPAASAFPLPVGLCKLARLIEAASPERAHPVVIWALEDGIIYGRLFQLEAGLRWGGRAPREGAPNDREFMAYFFDQPGLKFVPYQDAG